MKILYHKIIAITILVIVAAIIITLAVRNIRQSEVSIDVDDRIDVTPQQIESIKAIGEWEFLSIATEEMVDTVRKGIFSDDHLVRIYYGTLRLGVNMHHVEPGWIKSHGDSIDVTLPPIELLDRDFIDEARTKSFHESGRWSGQDREHLYQRAHRLMLSRCMTPQNIERARQMGETQFRQMMQAMGYRHVAIGWREE